MISCGNRKCNALNPPTAGFCMQCGTKLVTQNLTPNIFTASSKNFIEDIEGGVQLEMIYIPGGTFEMGNYDGEARENPQHEVNIKPFYLGNMCLLKNNTKR